MGDELGGSVCGLCVSHSHTVAALAAADVGPPSATNAAAAGALDHAAAVVMRGAGRRTAGAREWARGTWWASKRQSRGVDAALGGGTHDDVGGECWLGGCGSRCHGFWLERRSWWGTEGSWSGTARHVLGNVSSSRSVAGRAVSRSLLESSRTRLLYQLCPRMHRGRRSLRASHSCPCLWGRRRRPPATERFRWHGGETRVVHATCAGAMLANSAHKSSSRERVPAAARTRSLPFSGDRSARRDRGHVVLRVALDVSGGARAHGERGTHSGGKEGVRGGRGRGEGRGE